MQRSEHSVFRFGFPIVGAYCHLLEMNRISRLALRLALSSFILLVWAYILISHPHQNLIVNGKSEGDISVNHPMALLAGRIFSLVGGLALAGSALYVQFRLKPAATLANSSPGFNWRGVILLGIALLIILIALITGGVHH